MAEQITGATTVNELVEKVWDAFTNPAHVTTSFDPENENTIEMQKGGWQAILENFKKYTESQN